MKLLQPMLIFVFALGLSSISHAQRYELVWSDEFNGTYPDVNSWKFWSGTSFNNELQYYTNRTKNVRIEDGILILEAHRENYGGRNYTSARIFTEDAHYWKYGKIEARIKQPYGKGFWPAFWLMPQFSIYGGWPHSGEIDIMEFRGNRVNELLSTVHFSRGGGHQHIGRTTVYDIDLTADFHIYSVEWTNQGFTFFLDGVPHYTLLRSQIPADNYPFDEEFYIILNLAVGGHFLENPDQNTVFPMSLQVDWVRVYQDANQVPEMATSQRVFEIKGTNSDKIYAPAVDSDGSVDSMILRIPDIFYESQFPYTDSLPVPFLPQGEFEASIRFIDNNRAWSDWMDITLISDGGIQAQSTYLTEKSSLFDRFPFAFFDDGGYGVSFWANHPFTFFDNTIRKSVPFPIQNQQDEWILGPFKAESWMEYSFSLEEEVEVFIEVEAKATQANSRFRLFLDDTYLTLFSRIGVTDTFRVFQKGTFLMPAGDHVLKLVSDSEGLLYKTISFVPINTSIEDEEKHLATDFRILTAYPNPFNPTTQIKFELGLASTVHVTVINSLGQIIQNQQLGVLSTGIHQTQLDLTDFPSGVYWIQIQAGERLKSIPITLLK